MKFLEKDLEQIIFETQKETLEERGLYAKGKMYRQLRIGNYGVADLVTFERMMPCGMTKDGIYIRDKHLLTVFELKKEKLSVSGMLQGMKYVHGIKTYLEHRGIDLRDFSFRLVLIGKSVDTSGSFCFLPDYLYGDTFTFEMYTYNFDIDGLIFKDVSGYNLVNKGF